jgi:hypothetical protein
LERLPPKIRELAEQRYAKYFCLDPFHPALDGHFLVGYERDGKRVYAVSVGQRYRALAMHWTTGGVKHFVWFWIGSHEEYNRVVQQR